jgi:hypothetical protein
MFGKGAASRICGWQMLSTNHEPRTTNHACTTAPQMHRREWSRAKPDITPQLPRPRPRPCPGLALVFVLASRLVQAKSAAGPNIEHRQRLGWVGLGRAGLDRTGLDRTDAKREVVKWPCQHPQVGQTSLGEASDSYSSATAATAATATDIRGKRNEGAAARPAASGKREVGSGKREAQNESLEGSQFFRPIIVTYSSVTSEGKEPRHRRCPATRKDRLLNCRLCLTSASSIPHPPSRILHPASSILHALDEIRQCV